MTKNPFQTSSETNFNEKGFKIPEPIEHFFDKENNPYTPEKAKTDLVILETLETAPNITKENLRKLLEDNLIPDIGTNLFDKGGFVDQRLNKFLDRRDMVQEVTTEFDDPKELFIHLFGKEPGGRVQISPDVLSINIICDELTDVEYIYEASFTDKPTKGARGRILGTTVTVCKDPRVNGAVIAVANINGTNTHPLDKSAKLLEHEKRHILERLLADPEDLALSELFENFPDLKEIAKLSPEKLGETLEQYLVMYRELTYELFSKFELAAYIAQGLPTAEAVEKVITNYQFGEAAAAKIRNELLKTQNEDAAETIAGMVDNVFKDYEDAIRVAGKEIEQMQSDTALPVKVLAMRISNMHFRQIV